MPFSDTTPRAREVQFRVLRALSGEQRIILALEMSEFVRESARERIHAQHPDLDESRVKLELLKIAFFLIRFLPTCDEHHGSP